MRSVYLTSARRRAVFGAQTYGMRSRFLEEIPDALVDEPQPSVFRPGSLSFSRSLGGVSSLTAWDAAPAPTEPARAFRLGEDVVHAAFGDGVVTGVEPGGVIVVRFAGDGSERKLMAEYAPVSRR
jgi:DNA helicase-2/ATP-dependent DNA helicase PcrA